MLPDKSFKDLSWSPENRELIKEAVDQIIKDFAFTGISLEYPEPIEESYDDLYDQISALITQFLDFDQSKLGNLLYKIDVRQKDMAGFKIANHSTTKAKILTELILQREFEKVLLRNYFRNGGTF